jgi:ComF family protein
MGVIQELSHILFPTRCFGCSAIGISICSQCRKEWHPHYYQTHVSGLKVHSAILYSKTASKIILTAKENGIKGADNLIIDAITHVIKQGNFDKHNVRLVPIPSSSRNSRRRGRNFLEDICKKVSQQTHIPFTSLLTIVKRVEDQSGLSAKDRALNMKGAFGIKPGMHPLGDLLLIDDIVTTGATVTEASRALHAGGFNLLGSVTACVTQPLR